MTKNSAPKRFSVSVLLLIIAGIIWWPSCTSTPAEKEDTVEVSLPLGPDPSLEIPVVWENETEGHLVFQAEWSDLSVYPLGERHIVAYELRADCLSPEMELHKLKVDLLLRDDQEELIYTEEQSLVSTVMMRPGDVVPIQWQFLDTLEESPAVGSLLIRVKELDQKPATQSYAAPTPISILWEPAKPQAVDLDISLREHERKTGKQAASTQERFVFSVTNTGKLALELLRLEVRWYDQQDSLRNRASHLVVGPEDSYLNQDHRRISTQVVNLSGMAPEDIKRFEVAVVEVDY